MMMMMMILTLCIAMLAGAVEYTGYLMPKPFSKKNSNGII